jgi:hypothetical protein
MATLTNANTRLIHATKMARLAIVAQSSREAMVTFGNLQVRVTNSRLEYKLAGSIISRFDALKYIDRAGYAAVITT